MLYVANDLNKFKVKDINIYGTYHVQLFHIYLEKILNYLKNFISFLNYNLMQSDH